MTVEDLLNECGGFGKFQVVLIFGVFIHKVLAGWSMMQMSYAGYAPDWHCVVNETAYNNNNNDEGSLTLTLERCSLNDSHTGFREQSCRSYRFEGPSRTIITDWDLVCEDKWVKATITSIQMAGVLLGAVLSGQLADRYGRKKTLFGFALGHSLLNIGAAFSPSWGVFAAFRFFIGTGIGAILVVTLPYGMEFMPVKWRPLMSILPHWPMGVSLFALAAFVLKDWVYLHVAVGVLGLPTMVGVFYVPESARWLTLKGRYEEAEKIFEKMAMANGVTAPKHTRAVLEKLYTEEQELKSSLREYSYMDLFKGWTSIKVSLISCYSWFMLSMVFYGISFGVSALSGNLYLNIFLVGILEMPLNFTTFYFNNRIGRKMTFIALLVVGAITSCACLVVKLAASVESQDQLIAAFSIASKVGLAAAWTVSQTWVSELYPTVVRSLGYGLVNTAARMGGIVAPFSVDLDNRPLVAYAIITAMVIVAIFLSVFLPDTKGVLLSDSLTIVNDNAAPATGSQQQQQQHRAKGLKYTEDNNTNSREDIGLEENRDKTGVVGTGRTDSDGTLVHKF